MRTSNLSRLWRLRGGAIHSVLVRYASALAVVALAIVLRLWLDPVLAHSGFAIFLTGMLVAAWVGGLGPCLIGQTLILFAQALWFSPEHRVHSPLTFEGIVSLIAFYSVGGFVAVLSDAWRGSQKRLKAQTAEALSQREWLRTTLSCMGDGVLVTDAKGRLALMNPAAEEMIGWTLAETHGTPLLDVFVVCDEHSHKIIENPVRRALRDELVLHESMRMILTTRNDRRLPVSFSAAPIYDAARSVSGIVLVVRDETERRRAERALREADQRKDEFLATLAHELRNPLAPIAMGLELLKRTPDDPDATQEVISLMDRQAQHMVRLIDDLLDVSRITRGKLELRRRRVAVADVVRNAVDAARPAIEAANHNLTLRLPEQPVLLYADPNRLTQVLSNLLDNAAKYTPTGGELGLSAELSGDELAITVSDNGCGISAEQLESIFEMFMQVRGKMESGHKGLGIGLTLVKQLVAMHGGTVEVESNGVDKGSRFRVRLPVVAPGPDPESRPIIEHAEAPAMAARRVLVVDDNADALRSLSMLVSRLGHHTYEARDGVEAVEEAERVRPEVVLMDIGMPRLNGYEAARRIREAPWGRALVLAATTGWGQEEDRRRTKEAGFDYHLAKPIDPAQLAGLLASAAPEGRTAELGGHDAQSGARGARSQPAAARHYQENGSLKGD